MKKLIFTIGLMTTSLLSAQVTVDWSYFYDEGQCKHSQITSDEGIILVGYDIVDESSNQVKIVKTDSSGNFEWEKLYGGSGSDLGEYIFQTSDGGFLIAGSSNSTDGDVTGNHGDHDFWILKLNTEGNIQWQKSYGGTNEDMAKSIIPASDGGYIISGHTKSNDGDVSSNQGNADYWVVKIDSSGNLLWEKTYGGSNEDAAFNVEPTSDNGYILVGYTYSTDGDITSNHGDSDIWIIKMNSSGELIWQKTYGGSLDEMAETIKNTNDGGYILTGYSRSNDGDVSGSHGVVDVLVLKIDSSGTIQWQNLLGGSEGDGGNDVIQTADNHFVIAGYSRSHDGDLTEYYGTYTAWIFKLTPSGELVWQHSFGNVIPSFSLNIFEIAPDQFISSGESLGFWMMKFHYGELGMEEIQNQILTASPNPVSESLQITAKGEMKKIHIFQSDGKLIQTLKINDDQKNIDFQTLPKGIYFVQIEFEKSSKTLKIIKE